MSVCDLITHSRLPPVQRVAPKTAPVVAVTVQEEEEEDEEEVSMQVNEQRQEILVTTPISQQPSILKNNRNATAQSIGSSLPITEKKITPAPKKVVETPSPSPLPVVEIEPVSLESTPVVPVVLDSSSEKNPVIILEEEEEEEKEEETTSSDVVTTTTVTSTTIIEDDLIEDEDLEMPLIDMAGPDIDDDE